ncbi:hypothetical protein [Achromobacter denitrificans]|uniref:hypothetical protein n=1 Tax=Achromobacter denitrificans TaxID=32002 RepID=UPI001582ABDB|nr:hypothetical protein [Achromobacter denitrificans]
MSLFARIDDGTVKEVFENKTGRPMGDIFDASFVWVDITDVDPKPGEHWIYDGSLFSPPSAVQPDPVEVGKEKKALVQDYLDGTARALRYDSIADAITYADEPAVPKFQEEGRALRAWRSMVWQEFFALLENVDSGSRAMPTNEEIISLMPKLTL